MFLTCDLREPLLHAWQAIVRKNAHLNSNSWNQLPNIEFFCLVHEDICKGSTFLFIPCQEFLCTLWPQQISTRTGTVEMQSLNKHASNQPGLTHLFFSNSLEVDTVQIFESRQIVDFFPPTLRQNHIVFKNDYRTRVKSNLLPNLQMA